MASNYTVFLDESFDGFTNLSKLDGYFAYAALMVPTDRLPALDRFWNVARNDLVQEYKLATGFQIEGEFKSGYLNKLSLKARRRYGEKLNYFLSKNDCFVAGFYTTVRSFLMSHLRTEVAKHEENTSLPVDWETRLSTIKQDLLSEKAERPGDAHLLVGLFFQTLSITLKWLACQKASFHVVYDPRQKKEDRFLIQHADDWLARQAALDKSAGIYLGVKNLVSSAVCPGLMLVDHVVRDVRFLFSDLPELLSEQSSTQLVLATHGMIEPIVIKIAGQPMKWGDQHPMSHGLKEKLRTPTPNSMLSMYSQRLADRKLSCDAAFGESRVINFGLQTLENQVD